MKYTVVYAQKLSIGAAINELQEIVNSLCSNGWKPQGGISIERSQYNRYTVCQAMVK